MKLTEEELNIRLAIVTNQRNSALDEIVCLAAKIHMLEKQLNSYTIDCKQTKAPHADSTLSAGR